MLVVPYSKRAKTYLDLIHITDSVVELDGASLLSAKANYSGCRSCAVDGLPGKSSEIPTR
jgi:hypothetical protein